MSKRKPNTTPPRITPVVTPRRTTSRWDTCRRMILGPPGHQAVRRWSYVAFLVLLGISTFFYLRITNPERVRRQAEAFFEQYLNAEVRVGAAEFSFFHGVHLLDVEIRQFLPPGNTRMDSNKPPLFVCRDIVLRHNPVAALMGELVVQEVIAVSPACTLVHEADDQSFGFKDLLRPQKQGGSTGFGGKLPHVRFRGAELKVLTRSASSLDPVEKLRLNIVGTPVSDQRSGYWIDWRSLESRNAEGRLQYSFNEQVFKSVEGGLPWVSLEAILITLNEQIPGASRLCELITLEGELRADDFHIHPTGTGGIEHTAATIHLRDATLSVPVNLEEDSLPLEQRYLRVTNANGRITISKKGCQAEFNAEFHDGTCQVKASMKGMPTTFEELRTAGFDVEVTFTDLLLPDPDKDRPQGSTRLVNRWSELKEFFDDYDPHGHVDFNGRFVRQSGENKEIEFVGGRLSGKGCDGAHRFFRYRVSNLTGDVDLSPDGVEIHLRGDHNGSPIRVDGTTDSLEDWTPANVYFVAENLLLDQDVYRNLKPKYQRIWDLFSLAGRTDVTLRLFREGSTKTNRKDFETSIDADLTGVSMTYSRFPYPITELMGKVRIRSEDLEIEDLKGRAGAGRLEANGAASLKGEDLREMHIDLEARGIVFDETLFAALPEKASRRVRSFKPAGSFDVSGQITHEEGDRDTGYNLVASLNDVYAEPRQLPIPISAISGKVHVSPGLTDLEHVEGQYRDGRMKVNGTIHESDPTRTRVVLNCSNFPIEPQLVEKMPPAVRDSLKGFTVSGIVDADVQYRQVRKDEELTDRIESDIVLKGVDVTWSDFPLPLSNMTGSVSVTENKVRLQKIEARHQESTIKVDGLVEFDDRKTHATLALQGNGFSFTEALRKAVPWRWRRLWNDARPKGSFDFNLKTLKARKTKGSPTYWNIEGEAVLNGVSLEVGTTLEDLRGSVRGKVNSTPNDGFMAFSGAMELEKGAIHKRTFEDLKCSCTRSGESGRFHVFDILATMYGGKLEGQVEWGPQGEETTYSAWATISQVGFQPFFQAGRDPAKPPVETGGDLEARLYINGTGGKPDSFKTGGVIRVQNAKLFSLPLFVQLINVLAIVTPEELRKQSASAELFISGDVVDFREIRLEDSSLAMIGKGTLNRKTDVLDILLLAGTPRGGVELPVISELLQGTARELMEVHVKGTLEEPQIEARPLRGIDGALKTLLGGDRKKKE